MRRICYAFQLSSRKLQSVSLIMFILGTIYLKVDAESISKVVAKVNNEVITSKDLDDFCNFLKYRDPEMEITNDVRKEVLERLIEDKLILSQAKKEDISVPEGWLRENLDKLISSYPSLEAFEESLLKKGLNITMVREKLKEQYLTQAVIEKYVRSKIAISPQEITEFYNNHKKEFVYPKRYVIWIGKNTGKEKLAELAGQIQKEGIQSVGEFQNILNKVEVDEESLREEIKNIVTNLEEGELEIKKISDLYYLVYLEKIIPPSDMPLVEAKERVYSYLWQQKFNEAFQDWVKKLKEKAVIKIYE